MEIESTVDNILQECQNITLAAKVPLKSSSPLSPSCSPTKNGLPLSQGFYAPILVQRCPACFGRQDFGWPLDSSGDVPFTIAIDIQQKTAHLFMIPSTSFLNHKSMKSGDKSILHTSTLHNNTRFLCLTKRSTNVKPCTKQQMAKKKQKVAMDSFDDTSIMALICRHDIPLFFTNIDTPGEQQKYNVALIEHFFSLIPLGCNVIILYDIGCVLACSLMKVHIHPLFSWFLLT